ncbi:autotransporter outer membrane beta-barrel domain-containing protein [Manganibacter manganicus]|uniref:Autotransporter domain-containing protein n=1 Tax=Manganibacter manganicus TaxID=1873176 RepID=A0A1V8RTM0_9HYPH|nr:autotransporter domain-containing protein [Pseudaminobacter manganicus]OQM76537.1 hypothetical protein BFN67_14280 [Pseudaminobacter manganicus]
MQGNNNTGIEHKSGPLDLAAVLCSTTALTGFAVVVALVVGPARADEWTGVISGDWYTAGNWADGSVPTAADDVILNETTPNYTRIGPGVANADYLTIGAASSIGTLQVHSDGDLVTGGGTVGRSSLGTATIMGTGSTWNSGSLKVGDYAQGILTIGNGGAVSSGVTYLGYNAQGDATVTGLNSRWTITDDFTVGGGFPWVTGDGGLVIKDRGAATSVNTTLGQGDRSFGSVTVTGGGSTWTNSGYLHVGEHGTGTLTIEDGGAVTTGGNASVGRDSGGVGTATVTGLGSTWTTNGFLRIGSLTGSEGSLTIADQGTVISNSQVRLANAPDTLGTALVTGAGSKWIGPATQFHVGFKGEGSLTITDQGEVESDFTSLGYQGNGTAAVKDGAVWIISDDFGVGVGGTGVLEIDSGGKVKGIDSTIGVEAGGAGAVTVIGAGSTWTNTASLEVGGNGSGTLRVDAGGAVTNINGYIGRGAGSSGTAIVAGIASSWTNTGDLYVGDGGDGTLIIGPSATVTATGAVSVADQPGSSGLVVVNGDLVGTVGVNIGGRLAGFGTVTGNTTVGGTVAPGNSIGTLHIVGPYSQAAGSTYEVEIDAAGNSDLIEVAGAATLMGGTVEIISLPDFALATPYTILTATGGVTGTFAGTAMGFSSAFLTPQLTYGTNDVTFTIAQTASFASVALTPNQRAAAGGVDSLGAGNPVWDAIALLPSASAAPAAFDAISGEVHASAASVLIEDSRFVREAVDARLLAAFAGVGAKAMPVLAYGDDGPQAAPADTDRFAAWGHAFGSWGEWDNDGNAASLTRDTGGFVLGGDMAVADIWRLGLLAGYSSTSFDIDDRASSGSADSYHLGAYAGTKIGKWGLRFGGAYSWHAIDTARTASFAGFTDSLEAEYDASTAQFFAEAGYRIDTARISFEPFANLAYVNLHTDGFTETGGAAALTAASSSQNTTFTTLGLRAGTALPLGGITARLHGMLGWRHAFGDVTPTVDLAFTGGDAFTIAGVPIAKDAAIIEAGLDLALSPNAKLAIAYNGQIGDGVSDHGAKADLTVKF